MNQVCKWMLPVAIGCGLAAISASAAAAEQTTLVWSAPGGVDEFNVYIAIAKDFEALHPDITVNVVHSGDQEKLVAAGSSPDIVFSTIENFASNQRAGVFADLHPFIVADNFDTRAFFPPILNAYRFDGSQYGQGELYGIPKEISVRPIFYNKNLFNQAGLEDPNHLAASGRWNWQSFLADAKAITKENNGAQAPTVWGFAEDTWLGRWIPWIRGNGGRIVDNTYNPTKSEFNSQATIDAIDFFAKLRYSEHVFPPSGNTVNMFANGQLAMYANGRWEVPAFRRTATSFDWDVVQRPAGPVGNADLLTGSAFGVGGQSKHQKLAWELLKYITGVKAQTKMTEMGLLFPSRISVAKSAAFLDTHPPANNQAFIDSVAWAYPEPMTPVWTKAQNEIGPHLNALLAGKKSAKETAIAVDQIINQALASAQAK